MISDDAKNADHRVGIFIAKAPLWQDELAALRAILLDTSLTEIFKWRQPVYTSNGKNVAILWAFKDSCGLGFFKGALLSDPEGLLVAPGENSRSAKKLPFTSAAAIEAREALIRAYVAEAIAIEEKGLRVTPPGDDLPIPPELAGAFESDPHFKPAFDALTPGRRRSWLIHFGQAKQSTTRALRIAKAVRRIMEGKGQNDR